MAKHIPAVFATAPQVQVPVIDNDIALVATALGIMAATIVIAFVVVPWIIGQ
jgi:Asp/Glu/hydantoin racemase